MKKNIILFGNKTQSSVLPYVAKILQRIADDNHDEFVFTDATIEQNNFDRTVALCKTADAVLLETVGAEHRKILFPLVKALKTYSEILSFNEGKILLVKEACGGVYWGEHGIRRGALGREAFDAECYSEIEIERVARTAFDLAETRSQRIADIEMSDRLESSRLWRYSVHEVAQDYPYVTVGDFFADEIADRLTNQPSSFDVLLTSGLFGDILSDWLSVRYRDREIAPTSFLGETSFGIYTSAFTNSPISLFFAAAEMLEYGLDRKEEANRLRLAIRRALIESDINDIRTVTEKITEKL